MLMPDEQPIKSPEQKVVTDTSVSGDSTGNTPSTPFEISSAPLSTPSIPGYELLEQIGRGGMGVVFKARHLKLNRLVAIKLLPNAEFAKPEVLARFLTEAQAVAAVKHPNVIEIYDFGETNHSPYFVMELLEPKHFGDRYSPKVRHDPWEVARVLAKVARGVAEVHAEGIVHRDLKPANILFDKRGEPKVVDFGLAKRENSELTKSLATFGTLHYMAPEQAKGKTKHAGPPADVWALGVILYECLTGRRPFEGDDQISLLMSIATDEPELPRVLNAALPPEFEAIIVKCLAKKPPDRYSSARELADALDNHVHQSRTLKKAPAVEEKPPQEAKKEWTNILTVQGHAGPLRSISFDHAGLRVITSSEDQTAIIWDAKSGKHLGVLAGHKGPILAPSFNSDGSCVVTASDDQTTAVWDSKSGRRLSHFTWHSNWVRSAAFHPSKFRVVTTSLDQTAIVWHVKTGKLVTILKGHNDTVRAASFSSDGLRVVTIGDDQTAIVWEAETGIRISPHLPHNDTVRAAALNSDGSQVVTVSDDQTATIWDAITGTRLRTFTGHMDWIRSVSFSPSGSLLVTASDDHTAIVWCAKTGERNSTLQGHSGPVCAAAFSPDETCIVTASQDRTAIVWELLPPGSR